MTIVGVALVIAAFALLVEPWCSRPLTGRFLSAALTTAALVALAREHGAVPGVCLALAMAMASTAALVLARPLLPRVVAHVPAMAATVALVSVIVEVFRGA